MLKALVVTDSAFEIKSRRSGSPSAVPEVTAAFRERFQLDVEFNEDRYGIHFRHRMLDDLKSILSESHSFVWIISMVNDLFNNQSVVVPDRDGIKRAGLEYLKLLTGRNHVIVFGGRGSLKFEYY